MVDGWKVDRSRAAWWIVGAALGVAGLFVVYSFVGTFVFGIFLYYATRPVYRRLKRRVRPPSLAAAVALLALALPAILLVAYTLAIGVQELANATETADIGQLSAAVQPYANVSEIAQRPDRILANGNARHLQTALDSTLQYVGFVGNAALHLFVIIAIAFYLLRDDHKLSRWFRRTFTDSEGVLEAYVKRVDDDFDSVFFGNILNAALTAIIGAISYNALDALAPSELVGIPYPTLFGLLTGAASLIPVVGMKLVYFPVTLYVVVEAVLNGNPGQLWFAAVFFLVSFVIVDTIPDLVLRPYVSGRNLHVGMVMLAYIFGPMLFGWYGIFLGPMLLVLVVHFVEIVLPELIAGERIRPWAVDPTYMHDERADTTPQPPRDPGEGTDTSAGGRTGASAGGESGGEAGDGDASETAEVTPGEESPE